MAERRLPEFKPSEEGVTSPMGYIVEMTATIDELRGVLGEPRVFERLQGTESDPFGELRVGWVSQLEFDKKKPRVEVVCKFELRSFSLPEFTSPIKTVRWKLLAGKKYDADCVARILSRKLHEFRARSLSDAKNIL